MKVAPVSADLLIKLALLAAGIGAAWWAIGKVRDALPSTSDVLDAAAAMADSVNPVSTNNVAYRGVNAAGEVFAGTEPTAAGRNADGSWTLGGWIYDVTH